MKTVNGKPEFTGAIDVLTKVVRHEGIFALWKGFFPYYARLGPHTVLTFIFLEQMTAAYKNNFAWVEDNIFKKKVKILVEFFYCFKFY